MEVLNETSKDLDQLSASVMQEVDYKGNGEWKVVTECVRTVVGSRLDKVLRNRQGAIQLD